MPSLAEQMETDPPRRLQTDDRRQKWQRPDGKGKGHRPDKRGRDDNQTRSSNKWDALTDQVSGDEVRRLLALMTRLCLRQEDDLASVRADSAFLLYMETRPDQDIASGPYQPFTNRFFAIAQKWQSIKEATWTCPYAPPCCLPT